MTLYYNETAKPPRGAINKVRRHAERAHYDREAVETILDAAWFGHLAFAVDGQPFVMPMLYVRDGERVYLHGSPSSRLLKVMGGGARLCFTVTLIDGLVMARTWFHHSVNYRSVVLFGQGRPVDDRAEKLEAMRLLVEHIVPGRSDDARSPNDTELKATRIVALQISEASAKVRTGPPIDVGPDLELPVWAGTLPLRLTAGTLVADDGVNGTPPGYLTELESRPHS